MIATSAGVLTLTVPLKKGKHESQSITEVRIAYHEPWQKIHMASIQTAYQSAPYFDYYFPVIERLYASAGDLLFSFNLNILSEICHLLQLEVPDCTEIYRKNPPGVDLRGKLTPQNYSLIRLPKYNQVFEDRHGYLNNLSVLDLLFCLGPEAGYYLKSAPPVFNGDPEKS